MEVLERNNSLAQRVTRELGRAILCGEYKPNHSLPTEAKLCENFGVSRTAVREAVKMLSAKGLITSKPRQGIKVQPEIEWNLLDSELLEWSLESNPSMNVLKEYLQMRIAIEPEAAALAARYGSTESIDAIGEALSRMRVSAENGESNLDADIDFHINILYASHNRFYIHMRNFTRMALNVSIRHTDDVKADPVAVVEDHAKVYNAIKSGNAERAKNAMTLLIDEALTFVEQSLTDET